MALFLLKGFSFCDCLPTAAEVMRSAFVSPPTMVWGAFLRNCSHEFSPFTLVWRNYLAFDTLFPSLLYGWTFTADVTLKFSCRCEPVCFSHFYMSEFCRLWYPWIFPSLWYGGIFSRFATSNRKNFSCIRKSLTLVWRIFFGKRNLKKQKFFLHPKVPHFGMVEFFRQMQHQTVKFLYFPALRALPSIPLH